MNGSTHLINFFLTKTIDDVPDDDGEHYLVLPVLPGDRVADQTHPNPPDEAAHPHAREQPAGIAGVNAFRYCLFLTCVSQFHWGLCILL